MLSDDVLKEIKWLQAEYGQGTYERHIASEALRLDAELAAKTAECERLKDVLHLDRSGLAHALNKVQATIEGFGWIGRGAALSGSPQKGEVKT